MQFTAVFSYLDQNKCILCDGSRLGWENASWVLARQDKSITPSPVMRLLRKEN